jgi:hypothetical protein
VKSEVRAKLHLHHPGGKGNGDSHDVDLHVLLVEAHVGLWAMFGGQSLASHRQRAGCRPLYACPLGQGIVVAISQSAAYGRRRARRIARVASGA